MKFEWDEAKNESNIRKHEVDFADAVSIFSQTSLTEYDDRTDYGEDRWITIGMLNNMILVVVWTERRPNTIRIISARRANRHERKRYENYFKNELGTP